jgi:hypothetical protein
MDDTRFDTLTRALTTTRSRRGALAALLGGTLGLFGLSGMDAQQKGKGDKRRKKKGKGKKGNQKNSPHKEPGDVRNPLCGPGQGSVSGTCVSLSGGCGATTRNTYCSVSLSDPNGPSPCPNPEPGYAGACAMADDGPFCANGSSCASCQTDADCANEGLGPNVRCVRTCSVGGGCGASQCLMSYLDLPKGEPACVATGQPCPAGCDPAGSCAGCCTGECGGNATCGTFR